MVWRIAQNATHLVQDLEAPAGPATGVRRLTLVRHGETAENAAGRFLGRGDPPLSERGEAQARALAAAAHELGLGGATVVTSPSQRARRTAALLASRGAVTVVDALREADFGTWEGRTIGEVAAVDPEGAERFELGPVEGFPEGEQVTEVARRAIEAVDAGTATDLVAVSHATTIRVLVAALLGLPVSSYRQRLGRPANGSWTALQQTATGWMLTAYGVVPGPRGCSA